MLQSTDVNEALIRQAVDELEIGVPIRSWEVVDGVLLLHLAYSPEPARWRPSPPGESAIRTSHLSHAAKAAIPRGNLGRLRKAELREIARACALPGYRQLLKGELVEHLTTLRGA